LALNHQASLLAQTVYLLQGAGEGRGRRGTVPPRYCIGVVLGSVGVGLGFQGVYLGTGLGFEPIQIACLLFGLTALLGLFVVKALLLDGHACLVHALAFRRVDGGLLAAAPRLGRLCVIVIGQVALGERLPVGGLTGGALGG